MFPECARYLFRKKNPDIYFNFHIPLFLSDTVCTDRPTGAEGSLLWWSLPATWPCSSPIWEVSDALLRNIEQWWLWENVSSISWLSHGQAELAVPASQSSFFALLCCHGQHEAFPCCSPTEEQDTGQAPALCDPSCIYLSTCGLGTAPNLQPFRGDLAQWARFLTWWSRED